MKNIPLTYNIPFNLFTDELRRCILREFALNGAKHLVLGTTLIGMTMSDPELLKKVDKDMESAGLSFCDSHAPYGHHWDLGCVFEDERPALLSRIKTVIETVAFFNVKTMTIHMGIPSEGVSLEKHFANVCASLEELLPYAEERGVIICVENTFAWRGLHENLFKLKEIFPTDTLGYCFDSGHSNMTTKPETLEKAPLDSFGFIEHMLPHIVNCHIHDNDGMHDRHDLPGRGCVQWQKLVPLLKSAPRLKSVQSEVHMAAHGVAVRELVETFERLFH